MSIIKGSQGLEDDDLNRIIRNSQGVEELRLCTNLNNIDNNNITWRGVKILAKHWWDNLTHITLRNS